MQVRRSIVHFLKKLSPVQILLMYYFVTVIISTLFLSLPVAYKDGVEVPFIDSAFTAVSALSVTGLSTISIADTLSTTGVVILMIILQLGAVGIMAISTFVYLILGKKIGLKERRLIMTDQNQSTFEGMVRLIEQIILLLLTIDLIGFLVLGTYYLQYFPTPKEAYFNGLFSTVSAISNGGFDLTGSSLQPFKDDYFVQFVIMLLIIFGAIGFPVLIEVKQYIFTKRKKKRRFRFSLFTKVTTSTFFVLVIVGTAFIYLIDSSGFFKGKSWHESFFFALFQSVTTRSAGLSTMDVSLLTDSNHLFMSFLMFIGASPSSAGGGIRTTTFALVLIFIITYARGGKKVKIFNREIYDEDLLKAVTITILAIAIVFSSLLIISFIENFPMLQILFEVTSAFGTVGLSLGITEELSTVSKVLLMILMFIGRIGLVTFLFSFRKENLNEYIRYPKERIIIG